MRALRPGWLLTPKGLTLVELLVVLALIMVLAGLLLCCFLYSGGKARQTECASNLRQLAAALAMYAEDHGGHYPHFSSVSHYLLPDPEYSAGLLVQAMQPYCPDKRIWFCPSDPLRGKAVIDSTGAHLYTSYVTAVGAVAEIKPSRAIAFDGACLESDGTAWHFGGFNAAFADGRVKWFQLGDISPLKVD